MIEIQHSWRDEDAERSTHSLNVIDSAAADPTALMDALQSISAASLYRYGTVAKATIVDAAVSGPYDIRDRLKVTFRTVSGALLSMTIPAPLQAILANSDFVTLATPAIQALADAAIGKIQTRYGDAAASFVSAVREHYTRSR